MKYLFFTLFIFGSVSLLAQQKQSLKDLLYGGKLKKDSTGVIRNTDDLSKKIDTSTKKVNEEVKAKDSPTNDTKDKKTVSIKTDNNVSPSSDAVLVKDTTSVIATTGSITPAKTNTKLWREYTDSLVKTLKAAVLHSKQIKKDTYFLTVDYEIETDGQVNFTNIISTPENKFLQAQVKLIMDSTPLRLNPINDSGNQPKKVKRKQQISITKE